MKHTITITEEKEVELKTLHVFAGVRYWEDAEINGEPDESGENTPCKEGELWKPVIDLETGKIINWEQGKKASIHFKVCDAGNYYIKDENGETVLSIEDDNVPSILSPDRNGYGDYIIMEIDENGFIQNWEADISDFEKDEE